jgi:hypothetical protein
LLYGWEPAFSEGSGESRREVAIEKFKWGELSSGVIGGIMREFDQGEHVAPGFGAQRTKDR